MTNVTFKLDRTAGAEVLKNNTKIIEIENQAMSSLLSNIEAMFFQTFSVEGKFELTSFTTDRATAAIQPADKQTRFMLNQNPKWLATFLDNLSI